MYITYLKALKLYILLKYKRFTFTARSTHSNYIQNRSQEIRQNYSKLVFGTAINICRTFAKCETINHGFNLVT